MKFNKLNVCFNQTKIRTSFKIKKSLSEWTNILSEYLQTPQKLDCSNDEIKRKYNSQGIVSESHNMISVIKKKTPKLSRL